MSTESEQKFNVYKIESDTSVLQAIAICTAYRASAYIKAESFVLIQQSDTETLTIAKKISISNNAGPSCPIVLDETFALEEGLRQAEIDFSLHIHERNSKSSTSPDWAKKVFTEIPQRGLIRIWAYSQLKNELVRVLDATQCELLSNYLHSLNSLPTIKLSPLPL